LTSTFGHPLGVVLPSNLTRLGGAHAFTLTVGDLCGENSFETSASQHRVFLLRGTHTGCGRNSGIPVHSHHSCSLPHFFCSCALSCAPLALCRITITIITSSFQSLATLAPSLLVRLVGRGGFDPSQHYYNLRSRSIKQSNSFFPLAFEGGRFYSRFLLWYRLLFENIFSTVF